MLGAFVRTPVNNFANSMYVPVRTYLPTAMASTFCIVLVSGFVFQVRIQVRSELPLNLIFLLFKV